MDTTETPLLTPSGRPQRSTRSSVSYSLTNSRNSTTSSNNPYKKPTYSFGGGSRRAGNSGVDEDDNSSTPTTSRKKRGGASVPTPKTAPTVTVSASQRSRRQSTLPSKSTAISSNTPSSTSRPSRSNGSANKSKSKSNRRPECIVSSSRRSSTTKSRSRKRKKRADRDYGSDFDSDEQEYEDYEEDEDEDEEEADEMEVDQEEEELEDLVDDEMVNMPLNLDHTNEVPLPIYMDEVAQSTIEKLILPSSSDDLIIPKNLVLTAATVYEPIRRFSNLVRLTPFRFEDFCAALSSEEQSALLSEVHIQLLKTLLREDDASSTTYTSTDTKDSAASTLFFIDNMTWPEVLRAYLESDKEWSSTYNLYTSVDYPFTTPEIRLQILTWLIDNLLITPSIRDLLSNDGKILHEDHCRYCNRLGELICCETCPAVYHLGCIEGTFKDEQGPPDDWKCPICVNHELEGVSDCVSDLEKAGCLLRHEVVGYDRHGRKYWWLCRRLVVEDPETHSSVAYYTTKLQLEELIYRLDSENYEKSLVEKLEELRPEIEKHMEITEKITNAMNTGHRKTWIETENAFLARIIEDRKLTSESQKSENETSKTEESNESPTKNLPEEASAPQEKSSTPTTPLIPPEDSTLTPTRQTRLSSSPLYKLGSDNTYKSYINSYTGDPLALSKTQHAEERDRRRMMSHKFSLTTASECKWVGQQFGTSTVLLNTLKSTLLNVENSVPSTLMHINWPLIRKSWIAGVNASTSGRELSKALLTLSLCLRPCVFNPIWTEGSGHVKLIRITNTEKELRKKLEMKQKKDRDDEEEKYKLLKQFVKYPIIPKHTLFKQKGEEYRVHGGWGWVWFSNSRPIKSTDCRKLGLLKGPEKVVIQVKGGVDGKVKTMSIEPGVYERLMEKRNNTTTTKAEVDKEQPELENDEDTSTYESIIKNLIDQIVTQEEAELEEKKEEPSSKSASKIEPQLPSSSKKSSLFRHDLINISLGLTSANRILYPKIAHKTKVLDSLLARRLKLSQEEEKKLSDLYGDKLNSVKLIQQKSKELEDLKQNTKIQTMDSSFPLSEAYTYKCYSKLCNEEAEKIKNNEPNANLNYEKFCYSPMCRLKYVILESRRKKSLREKQLEVDELTQLKAEIDKAKIYSVSNSTNGIIYLKKSLAEDKNDQKVLIPVPSKFKTTQTKKHSILILPQHDLKKLCRTAGLIFTPPGYSTNTKSMNYTWPYPCGRPFYKTTWNYRCVLIGDNIDKLMIGGASMQLRLLVGSVRWDDIQMKPPPSSDGKSQMQTDMEIITTEILDQRIIGRFKEIVQYLRRRHIDTVMVYKQITTTTPDPSSTSLVHEDWVNEDQFEVWEIRYYGDKAERKKLEPPPSSSTRTKSGILLKQPEKFDPSTEKEKKDKENVNKETTGSPTTPLKKGQSTTPIPEKDPFPLDKKIELQSKREKKQPQQYGNENQTTTTTVSKPQTASQQLAASKGAINGKSPAPTVPSTTATATPSTPGQRLQVFKGPDGRLQVKGLLPNQSCYQTGDGKIHVVTNPNPTVGVQKAGQAKGTGPATPGAAQPVQKFVGPGTPNNPGAVVTSTASHLPEPRKSSILRTESPATSPVVGSKIATPPRPNAPISTPSPASKGPRLPLSTPTGTSNSPITAMRGADGRIHIRGIPPGQKAVQAADGTIHIVSASSTFGNVAASPTPVAPPAPVAPPTPVAPTTPIAPPTPIASPVLPPPAQQTTQTITATRTPEGHVEVKGLLPGQNATQDPDGNILITAPVQPGELTGKVLAKINVSNLQVPQAPQLPAPVIPKVEKPPELPSPNLEQPRSTVPNLEPGHQLIGSAGSITATRAPDGRIEVHGLAPDQTAVQLPDGRIQIITNPKEVLTPTPTVAAPAPRIPTPAAVQTQMSPAPPVPRPAQATPTPGNNIIARKLPNGSYEFEGLQPGQRAIQLPDGRICVVNTPNTAMTTQLQQKRLFNPAIATSVGVNGNQKIPQQQQSQQQQQIQQQSKPITTTPPPGKIRIQTPKGILEIDSKCLVTNPITGQTQIVINKSSASSAPGPGQLSNATTPIGIINSRGKVSSIGAVGTDQMVRGLPICIVSPTKMRQQQMVFGAGGTIGIGGSVQQHQMMSTAMPITTPTPILPQVKQEPASAVQVHHTTNPTISNISVNSQQQNVPLGKNNQLPPNLITAKKSKPPPLPRPTSPTKAKKSKSPVRSPTKASNATSLPTTKPQLQQLNAREPIPSTTSTVPKLQLQEKSPSVPPVTQNDPSPIPTLTVVSTSSPTKPKPVDEPINHQTPNPPTVAPKPTSRRKSPLRNRKCNRTSPTNTALAKSPHDQHPQDLLNHNETTPGPQPISPQLRQLLITRRELLKLDVIAKRTKLERAFLADVRNEIQESLKKFEIGRQEKQKMKQFSQSPIDNQNNRKKVKSGKKRNLSEPPTAYENVIPKKSPKLSTGKSKSKSLKSSPKPSTSKSTTITPTPSRLSSSKLKLTGHPIGRPKKSQTSQEQLLCICRTPYDQSKFMVACDKCDNWFHGECVGMDEDMSKVINEWICEGCQSQEQTIAPVAIEKKKQKQQQKSSGASSGGTASTSSQQKELFCLCRQPYDDSKFYICCDSCSDWFHGRCVGILQLEGESLTTYNCPKCDPTLPINRANMKNLNDEDYGELKKLLKQVQGHKSSWAFRQPVDGGEAKDYYRVIKEPMDLLTITHRLEAKSYLRLADFIGDIMRIFENCRYFNAPDSSFVKSADQLEVFVGGKVKGVRGKMVS